jgi:signal transduction histidine kinase/CheY-like chemotaxis protein/AraC-like DNA-binding protein
MKFVVRILVLCFSVFASAFSQAPRFDRFDISSGLSQNNINGLVIDDIGNIWVGTLDGLNKYNGYEFEVFKPLSDDSDGISGNHIISMGKGLNGDIWVTTRDRVLNHYRADVQRFRHFPDSVFEAAGIAPVNNLVQLNDSLLWFSDNDQLGLLNTRQNVCKKFQAPGWVHGIALIGDSTIIYGGFGIQYLRLDKEDSILSIVPVDISGSPCFHLQQDGAAWYGISDSGIERISNQFTLREIVATFRELGLSFLEPSSLNSFTVHRGNFWLGDNNLLARVQRSGNGYSTTFFSYDPGNDSSFKGYHVTHLRFDALGNLWIGTLKNGLNYFSYKKNQFIHYNWRRQKLNSPDTDPVRAICKRDNDDIWLSFDREGVGIIDKKGEQRYFSHYFTREGTNRNINNVRNIFEDSSGNIWIGEGSRLCIYNQAKQRIEAVNCRFSWDWPYQCYSVKELETGIVTLTSSQRTGKVNLKTGELSVFSLDESVSGSVRDIVKDKYGSLWIAKDENGLLKYDGPDKPIRSIRSSTHGLSDNKAYCLWVAGDSLWIGTNAGLNLFSITGDSIIDKYFESDGLSNNIVYSLYYDAEDNMWMSTNRGITRFDVKNRQFVTFLTNDFFMDDAHFVSDDGFIYYGGYTGVVGFHPDSISTLHPGMKIHFESFRLFNREILPGDSIGNRVLIKENLKNNSLIRLKHDENSFSVEFNAYPFDYPNHNVFRFRLRGLQKEWTYSDGANRIASYTAVPPGEYTFELQAAPNRQSLDSIQRLRVVIIPPFWQTAWFRGVLIVGLVGGVFGGYQIRLRQIRKRNLLLKSTVDEQTKELRARNQQILEMSEKLHEADQSKLRFFTNISHDFRTPLTLILAHLDSFDQQKNKAVHAIRRNAYRLLNMINQLIDLRKLDQGQLKLSVRNFELVTFITEIVQSFRPVATQKDIELAFYSFPERLSVWLDADKLENILYNLLSNAIKYSPQGKTVMVSVGESDDQFYIDVEDQGIGIPKNELLSIFDRFYRSGKVNNHIEGHGIGLTIVKGLTELQKGTVEIESSEGRGTRFRLSFLKGQEHFGKNDFDKSSTGTYVHDDKVFLDDEHENFSRFGRQKVLIVEDNVELSRFLKELLGRWFEVSIARNGKDAVGKVSDFKPDLIVSDVMMPVMNGIEFCRKIKSDDRTANIPFVFLTARTDEETHIEGFELGIDGYIEKPFNGRIFLARLMAILENRSKLTRHLEEQKKSGVGDAGLSKSDRDFLETVNALIDKRYSDPAFNVEILGKELFMSRSSFYRKFKDVTGITAAGYIRKIRLHKAASLLKNDGIQVSQVAERVGFQSVAQFRKSFREEFGKTPGEWAKS